MPSRSGLAAWQQIVLLAYIEKHTAERINVRALARFVYLSPDCFRRAFKRTFGIPPHEYLAQQRIERAKGLLAGTAWPIGKIGLALGFSQATSFSAAFRKVTGITPTEYRRTERSLRGPYEKRELRDAMRERDFESNASTDGRPRSMSDLDR
jgi:AraC family transcriptional regulator